MKPASRRPPPPLLGARAADRHDPAEWEALCDGCGKCCLNKLEDADTGEVEFTRVACRLFDGETCRCGHYAIRKQFVPECVVLTPENIEHNAYWMPRTCAYRLLYEGKPLYDWHPLISGRPASVHEAGVSVRGLDGTGVRGARGRVGRPHHRRADVIAQATQGRRSAPGAAADCPRAALPPARRKPAA